MNFDNIYKRGTDGSIRQWRMEVEGPHYRSISQVVGGRATVSNWHEAHPKNLGRSNATTSNQQAVFECESKYDKKLKTGFVRDVKDIDTVSYIKAMKATTYKNRHDKIPFHEGVYLQPKLNGIRCIATKDKLFTYGGEEIKSCPHISRALKPAFDMFPDLIFDGELYNHSYRDDLPTLSGLVRLQNPDMFQLQETERVLQYHVFDTMSPGSFRHRWVFLSDLCSPLSPVVDINHIEEVYTQTAHSESDADAYFERWVGQGYEGQMIRINDEYQRGKRSNLLIKRKEFVDAEFPVLSVEEGQGNWAGCAKRVTVRLPNGLTCGSGIRGTQAQMKYLLAQSRRGILPEEVTVRYLKETPEGRLDIPVVTNIHWKKRKD